MSPGDRPDDDQRFISEAGVAGDIAALTEPTIIDLGYRLIRVKLSTGPDTRVQIMAERPDGSMTIEDCETLSRQLSPLLDAHEPIADSYRLEISSPGIDRPLVRPSDFEVWAGYEAKIEVKQPIGGRKRFRGQLEGFADGEVRIECEIADLGRQVIGLPVALIADAKLVLTDELVREALRQSKKKINVGEAP